MRIQDFNIYQLLCLLLLQLVCGADASRHEDEDEARQPASPAKSFLHLAIVPLKTQDAATVPSAETAAPDAALRLLPLS